MTVPATKTAAESGAARQVDFTIAHDGSYAARLVRRDADAWFPERWTLDGPEPYAVPLPGNQPEEPGSEVLPLADGRVLIRRFADGRHTFSLLYPTGPGTGELPLGAVQCRTRRRRLLPPGTVRRTVRYALTAGRTRPRCGWWREAPSGPSTLAEIAGALLRRRVAGPYGPDARAGPRDGRGRPRRSRSIWSGAAR